MMLGRRKLFLAIVVGPAALLALAAVSVNAIIDPLWIMPKMGARPGIRYCVQDERTNKLNRLIYGRLDDNSLLIGSSRATFFDTRYFQNHRTFNFGVSSALLLEFPDIVRMFVKHVRPPTDVYLALDFYNYLKTTDDQSYLGRLREREALSEEPLYRLRTLMDWSTLEYSAKLLRECSADPWKIPAYDYDGHHLAPRNPEDAHLVDEQVKIFAEQVYTRPVDPAFRAILLDIKAASRGSNFHAFVPPIREQLFDAIIRSGRLEDYIDWLGVLVDVFGGVFQFSGPNAFTADTANFYDAHHVYADRTEGMIAILEGRRSAAADGFEPFLTARNLPRYAAMLRARYGRPPDSGR